MKFLYIGQYSSGTTSKMRADTLKEILPDWEFQIINIHKPFFKTPKILRSFGFRFKKGALIKNINRFVLDNLFSDYDVIWTDKAVFLTHQTTDLLRKKANRLLHFTPDPAFTYHQSKHFNESLRFYDFVVTTKSYELAFYSGFLPESKIICTSQGFDLTIHKPFNTFESKVNALLFIGHFETNRSKIISRLIENNINVCIAGPKWSRFYNKNKASKHLTYLGSGLYGDDYSKTISQYQIAWGAVSKWIPEMHTTRTFEIPACGTALITEKNDETTRFFKDDEVIFYSDEKEFVEKINYWLAHPNELTLLSEKGYKKVLEQGYDYKSILKKILIQTGIIKL